MKSSFHNHLSAKKKLLFLVFFSLLLTGCAKLVRTEQPSVLDWALLSEANTVGQTFVAKYDGLSGIYFYLSPQSSGDGQIKLHVRSEPMAESDLAVSVNSLSIKAIKDPGFYGFLIPALPSSNQKYYYAFLDVVGSGDIQVGKATGGTYLNGALYQNGAPEDAQSAFQLLYSWRKAIPGLGREVIAWGAILIAGFFLFILPGWGLFNLLWPGWGGLAWAEKLGLSAGLSLAIYPLLLLWTDLIGLHLGAIYAWLPALAGLGLILWRNRKRFHVGKLTRFNLPKFKYIKATLWPDLAFLVVLTLLVFTRFWAIRSLDEPMWWDSYQHTMISQLLVDHGGLFTSWQPYAELKTFTYHFGFHAAVAVFDWITALDVSKAVLWVGQLLNILAVIALYPLATKVGHNRWAGVVAVLVAGLFSPMPMHYVSWGRYTQLAGQVILPVVVWLMWNTLVPDPLSSLPGVPSVKRGTINTLILCWLAIGGLALTHYRVLILALLFLATVWILYARRMTIRLMFLKTLWTGIGAGLLFLPWFVRAFGGRMMEIFSHQVTTSAVTTLETDPEVAYIGSVSFYMPFLIWLALPIVIGLGAWRREKGLVLISLWWFVNLLAGNPYWLGLPGAGVISTGAVLIAAYFPAAILLGAAASWLDKQKTFTPGPLSRIRAGLSLGAVILCLGMGIWGARQRQNDVQMSTYALATRPDILAAKWIQENTGPEAELLINSRHQFSNYVIIGSDGGGWLPLLAHRQTSVPPINYAFERDPWPGYRVQVNALTFEIEAKGVQNPEIISMLNDRNISYIYVGQRQGLVNSMGPLLTVDQLLAAPKMFLPVYHQDRVWIFKIQQAP